jgi:hypothetical protein
VISCAQMKTKDFITGLAVVAVVLSGYFLIKNNQNKKAIANSSPTPSIEQQITQKFGNIKIPENADKADLTNVVPGGIGMGEAARTYEKGKYALTVLADLPEPKAGYFYQGWLSDGKTFLSLGKLRVAKGGYLVDFSATKDYTSYKKVVVTTEKIFDNTPETYVLEGSF